MQYTALSFTQPLRLMFQAVLQPRRTIELNRSRSPHLVESIHYEERVHPIYERYFYNRGVGLLMAVSQRVRLLQNGSIRAYLAYIFITLVVVLVLAR
jgi:hydrogenase-4 component B